MEKGKCKWCEKEKELNTCEACGLQGLMNKYPMIFQESIKDMIELEIKPRLNEIVSEINLLKELIKRKKSNNRKL